MPWPKGTAHTPEMIAKRLKTFGINGSKRKKPRVIDGIEQWLCPTCEKWLPRTGFYGSKKTWNGITSQCKNCHMKGSIATRDIDRKRDSNREHMRQARRKNPEKFNERERLAQAQRPWTQQREARYQLNLAVQRGEILKPNHCEHCGGGSKLQAHHTDYSKALEVLWLCPECHSKEHRK